MNWRKNMLLLREKSKRSAGARDKNIYSKEFSIEYNLVCEKCRQHQNLWVDFHTLKQVYFVSFNRNVLLSQFHYYIYTNVFKQGIDHEYIKFEGKNLTLYNWSKIEKIFKQKRGKSELSKLRKTEEVNLETTKLS